MHLAMSIQATPGLSQGTAQAHHHHPGPRASDHPVETCCGQQSCLAGPHHVTGLQQRLAVADIAAQRADVIPRPDPVADGDGVCVHVGAVERDDGVSAKRDRISCADPHTGAHLHLADPGLLDAQCAAGGLVAARHVLSPQREAIQLGAIEGRQVLGGPDVLAQGQTPCVQQVHAIGARG